MGSIHDAPVFVIETTEQQAKAHLDVRDIWHRYDDYSVVSQMRCCHLEDSHRVSSVFEDITEYHRVHLPFQPAPNLWLLDAANDQLVVVRPRLNGRSRIQLDASKPALRGISSKELADVANGASNIQDHRAFASQLRQSVARVFLSRADSTRIDELVARKHVAIMLRDPVRPAQTDFQSKAAISRVFLVRRSPCHDACTLDCQSALSVPRSNTLTPAAPAAQTAAGFEVHWPPKFPQAPHAPLKSSR